ncbi:MAG: NADH dehydrogenase subunit C [Acidobacteria bacterium OLB17]|nr:MAG: NADH dehydrogenase subunit C [Acidobacteria bacterium OLB17]MCZ2390128.1 NADH-quinone oxidoreductase subunit C [Acidobacteriota bacterium]
MTEKLQTFVDALKQKDPAWVLDVVSAHGETTVFVGRENIIDACIFLRDEHHFDMLADLCGGDLGPEEDPRFFVNYHLFSTTHHSRLRLKVFLPEDDPKVASATSVWKTANWHERETYDFFGIIFEGHPDLRRILLPSDFDGFALRKDYPLRGYEPYSLN